HTPRTPPTYPLSLHDALPIYPRARRAISAYLVGSPERGIDTMTAGALLGSWAAEDPTDGLPEYLLGKDLANRGLYADAAERFDRDRKSTRLNSSHVKISYAVF